MKSELRELITHRLARAEEALEEADVMLHIGHGNAATSRLYYACFYAVSALLLLEGKSSSKHSGVRSLFNRDWIKSGRIPEEAGDLYNRLFDSRQKGDYGDFVHFEVSQVQQWRDQSRDFIMNTSRLAKDYMDKYGATTE